MHYKQVRKLVLLSLVLSLSNLLFSQEAQLFKVEVAGKGQPIVFIPGLNSSGEVWESTVERFSKSYECHVFTLAGFAGQPAIGLEKGFLPQMEAGIIQYIKQNKLEAPIITGHSLGGFLALSIAIAEPELLSSIVVVDAVPFLPAIQMPNATEESTKEIADGMKKQMANQSEKQREAFARVAISSMITAEEDIETAVAWGNASDPATSAQAMYEMYRTDLRKDVAKIKVPTLVLGAWIGYKNYGVTREMVSNNYNAQYAGLEGVEIKISDIGKHFLMWDDPEFTFQAMQQFFAKHIVKK